MPVVAERRKTRKKVKEEEYKVKMNNKNALYACNERNGLGHSLNTYHSKLKTLQKKEGSSSHPLARMVSAMQSELAHTKT